MRQSIIINNEKTQQPSKETYHRNPNKIPAIDPQFPNNISDIKRILRKMTT